MINDYDHKMGGIGRLSKSFLSSGKVIDQVVDQEVYDRRINHLINTFVRFCIYAYLSKKK
jgi:hypothetical protein